MTSNVIFKERSSEVAILQYVGQIKKRGRNKKSFINNDIYIIDKSFQKVIKKSSVDSSWSIIADNTNNANDNYVRSPAGIFVTESGDIYIGDEGIPKVIKKSSNDSSWSLIAETNTSNYGGNLNYIEQVKSIL